MNLNLIYGPPCKNRTYDRPLGGARYIHLTNEGYINILYIKNNKKHYFKCEENKINMMDVEFSDIYM